MIKGEGNLFSEFKPQLARLRRRVLSRFSEVANPALGLTGGDRPATADDKQPYVHSAAVASAQRLTYIGSLSSLPPKHSVLPLQGNTLRAGRCRSGSAPRVKSPFLAILILVSLSRRC